MCRLGHQFSVTSGSIFASRKMSFTDLLAAVCIFVNSAKGISALQLSRDLDCQYKTAFVLSHKLREAMAAEIKGHTLDDEVEIDGAYFGGHIRPENHKEDRKDRRLAKMFVDRNAIIYADEASHWDALHDGRKTYRINHSEAYVIDHVSTNQAESFFSRLRRMVRGQHHHVSARYLHQYANQLHGLKTIAAKATAN